ncbi:MAG TPA: hypothetical protein VGH28_14785 [Polyangiaceae bacterium]
MLVFLLFGGCVRDDAVIVPDAGDASTADSPSEPQADVAADVTPEVTCSCTGKTCGDDGCGPNALQRVGHLRTWPRRVELVSRD